MKEPGGDEALAKYIQFRVFLGRTFKKRRSWTWGWSNISKIVKEISNRWVKYLENLKKNIPITTKEQSRLTQKDCLAKFFNECVQCLCCKIVSTATYRKEIWEENKEENDQHCVPLKSVTFDCKASLDCWDGWMLTMKSWEINSELTN